MTINIEFQETDESGIDLIQPLWEKLNEQHRFQSPHFSSYYETFTFGQRKSDLMIKAKDGQMRICLAKERDTGRYLGYCVSTLIKEGEKLIGEVDSIYVERAYRSLGIGDALMKNALNWMDASGANVKKVSVGAGNEVVLPFYARYDFYPRMTTLQQKKN